MLHFIVFHILYCFVAVAASFLYFGILPKLGFHTVTNALSMPQSSIQMWIAVDFGSHFSELTNY